MSAARIPDGTPPGLVALIEAELDRLAKRHEAPEAFESLCWVLWQARRVSVG